MQARISTVFAMDLHPAARMGKGILIDHGRAGTFHVALFCSQKTKTLSINDSQNGPCNKSDTRE
jgi:hypothetical protein